MGEIADQMIEGEICEQCGQYLGSRVGYPQLCPACQREEEAGHGTPGKGPAKPAKRVTCGACGKKVKASGLVDHVRDAHGMREGYTHKRSRRPA